jgi:hypothetical protein
VYNCVQLLFSTRVNSQLVGNCDTLLLLLQLPILADNSAHDHFTADATTPAAADA